MAMPVGAVGSQERAEVELVDHVQDEPGQVAFGEPVAQVWGQQEGLVAVAAQEVVGHGACYRFTPFIPNANCFLRVNFGAAVDHPRLWPSASSGRTPGPTPTL
jgi:hypothetical protein